MEIRRSRDQIRGPQDGRQDQRTAILRLKRVMMSAMAEHGVEREIPPDGPAAWMIDQEVVRELYYVQTAADGTPKQKLDARRQQFNRARDWAEAQELIASHEIDDVVYLRLCSHKAGDTNEECSIPHAGHFTSYALESRPSVPLSH